MLSKIAALAALGVALYPCGCDGHAQTILGLHYIAAAIMFVVLAYFCYMFYKRAHANAYAEDRRARLYAVCGVVIVVSILALVADTVFKFSDAIPRFVFYFEFAWLFAFGVSWLTASRILPVLSRGEERRAAIAFRKRVTPARANAVVSYTLRTRTS